MNTTQTIQARIRPENELPAKMWNAGGAKYDRISRQIADAIGHCVDRLNPRSDEQILDVATGTGWTARQVYANGANVAAIDLGADVIEAARQMEFGNEIEFKN